MLSPCHRRDMHWPIGNWLTDQMFLQGGPAVTTCSFDTNGTFTRLTRFTYGSSPTVITTGTYHFATNAPALTNQIVVVTNGRTNVHSYYFQGSMLVIDEGRPNWI